LGRVAEQYSSLFAPTFSEVKGGLVNSY
jgi:hypothetical protein